MNCLIVVNAYIKNKSQKMQAERIAEELRLLGAECEVAENINLSQISGGKAIGKNCDCCIFLDKDKASARLFEKRRIRLFNSAKAIEICDDKMITHIELLNHGIPMPDSLYAPLCYYPDAEIPEKFLNGVAELGFPLIAKLCYGSLGSGVFKIENKAELRDFEEQNKLRAHFYQKFIGHGSEDIRVIVIGGKYVCAMKRRNEHDFRSNVEQGGVGEKYTADEQLIELCEKVASVLQRDYCGIDVLTDFDGKRYICEVNSNAFFAEAERVCGVNIAKKYAELIIASKNT
ncbi:MAG: RimK family alpha-L-glutamate ligase [Clostridia bacterium]|nr:RimK family alpha-L-glutamate ligase [Clostridia bacterium]